MTIRLLIFKSARFYARSHLGTAIGAAVGAAALVGALAVGDSLRGSLRERALQRLGWIHLAMAPQDRFFAPELAKSFSGFEAATALALPGIATSEATEKRANHVSVYGIGAKFFGSNEPAFPQPGEVLLNATLADATGAKVGDELLLRIPKPSALSREIAVTPHNEETIGFRLKVARILGSEEMADFSLRNSQVPPANAFVNLQELSEKAGGSNRVNLLLLGGSNDGRSAGRAEVALGNVTNAGALGIDLRITPDRKEIELWSDRIFLEPELVRAADLALSNSQPDTDPHVSGEPDPTRHKWHALLDDYCGGSAIHASRPKGRRDCASGLACPRPASECRQRNYHQVFRSRVRGATR